MLDRFVLAVKEENKDMHFARLEFWWYNDHFLRRRVKAVLTFPRGGSGGKPFQFHLSHNLYNHGSKRGDFLIHTFILLSNLSAHHPAHSCTPWADMFHSSVGHARQPTQRVSSLALKIRAEWAATTEGDTEREGEKKKRETGSCIHRWIQHSDRTTREGWPFCMILRKAAGMQLKPAGNDWCCCRIVSERPFTSQLCINWNCGKIASRMILKAEWKEVTTGWSHYSSSFVCRRGLVLPKQGKHLTVQKILETSLINVKQSLTRSTIKRGNKIYRQTFFSMERMIWGVFFPPTHNNTHTSIHTRL